MINILNFAPVGLQKSHLQLSKVSETNMSLKEILVSRLTFTWPLYEKWNFHVERLQISTQDQYFDIAPSSSAVLGSMMSYWKTRPISEQ